METEGFKSSLNKIADKLDKKHQTLDMLRIILSVSGMTGSGLVLFGSGWTFKDFTESSHIGVVGASLALVAGLGTFSIKLVRDCYDNSSIKATRDVFLGRGKYPSVYIVSKDTNLIGLSKPTLCAFSDLILEPEEPLCTVRSFLLLCCGGKIWRVVEDAFLTILPAWILIGSIKDLQKIFTTVVDSVSSGKNPLVIVPSLITNRSFVPSHKQTWLSLNDLGKAMEVFDTFLAFACFVVNVVTLFYFCYKVIKWREKNTTKIAEKIRNLAKEMQLQSLPPSEDVVVEH
ncbi:uncharacterized protein [Haliotis asinina]|uniref:uncharacterized protein n=1 Tax=Haliotis asinina TaxID=109174 RepID=UPI0035318E34